MQRSAPSTITHLISSFETFEISGLSSIVKGTKSPASMLVKPFADITMSVSGTLTSTLTLFETFSSALAITSTTAPGNASSLIVKVFPLIVAYSPPDTIS